MILERLKNFLITLLLCLLIGAGVGSALLFSGIWITVSTSADISGLVIFLYFILPGLLLFFLYFWVYLMLEARSIFRALTILFFGLGWLLAVSAPFEYLIGKNFVEDVY